MLYTFFSFFFLHSLPGDSGKCELPESVSRLFFPFTSPPNSVWLSFPWPSRCDICYYIFFATILFRVFYLSMLWPWPPKGSELPFPTVFFSTNASTPVPRQQTSYIIGEELFAVWINCVWVVLDRAPVFTFWDVASEKDTKGPLTCFYLLGRGCTPLVSIFLSCSLFVSRVGV